MRRIHPNSLALLRCGFAAFAAFFVACGGASKPAPAAATTKAETEAPKPATGAPAEDTHKKQAAAIESLAQDEVKSGACNADLKSELEKLLDDLAKTMPAKTGEDGKSLGIQIVDKRTVALTDTPRSISIAVTGKGTEVHVLAFSLREVSMDVLNQSAARGGTNATTATTMRSPFQRNATSAAPKITLPSVGTVTEIESDSRQIQVKPGQSIDVRLRGQGCSALAVVQKP